MLAGEMDKSAFDYRPTVSIPGQGTTTLNMCAFANNTPSSAFTTGANPSCPTGQQPWRMTCLMMGFVGSMGDTIAFENMTLLESVAQESTDSFKQYVEGAVPEEYLEENPNLLNGCMLSGATVLIVVFAIMNGGQGFGKAWTPPLRSALASRARPRSTTSSPASRRSTVSTSGAPSRPP